MSVINLPEVPSWVRSYLSRGRHAIQAEVDGVTELQVVGEDDPRAMPVATAIHLGIKLLETSRGQAELRNMGGRIVNHSDLYQYVFDPLKHDMNNVVTHFVEKLRQQTPDVILSGRIKEPVYLCRSTFTEVWRDLNEWSPRKTSSIYVNEDLVTRLASVWACCTNPEERQYVDNAVFYLGACIFGQLAHAFVHRITGLCRLFPPAYIDLLPELDKYRDRDHVGGDPGRYLQGMLLGGLVELYRHRDKADGYDIFLIDRHHMVHAVETTQINSLAYTNDATLPMRRIGYEMPLEEFLENGVHFSADLKDLRSENAGGRANYVETISEREHEDKDTDTTEDEADGSIKRENEETGTTEEEADNSSEFVS